MGLGMSSAVDIKNVNIDLSPWLSSLSDVDTHTITDVTSNGLCPLYAFLLEENFRTRMERTYLGQLLSNDKNILPLYKKYNWEYTPQLGLKGIKGLHPNEEL